MLRLYNLNVIRIILPNYKNIMYFQRDIHFYLSVIFFASFILNRKMFISNIVYLILFFNF